MLKRAVQYYENVWHQDMENTRESDTHYSRSINIYV